VNKDDYCVRISQFVIFLLRVYAMFMRNNSASFSKYVERLKRKLKMFFYTDRNTMSWSFFGNFGAV